MVIDQAAIERLREFTAKHCGGKEPRLDLLQDICRALNLNLRVRVVDDK
jgi:hypothetical protein